MVDRPLKRPVDTRTDIEKESDRLLQNIQKDKNIKESGPFKRPAPTKYTDGSKPVLTPEGRSIWQGLDGSVYSEKTTTLELPNGSGKWYTIPTIDKDGSQLSDDKAAELFLKNNRTDYITGEKLPEFNNVKDAEQYAKERSNALGFLASSRGKNEVNRENWLEFTNKYSETGAELDDYYQAKDKRELKDTRLVELFGADNMNRIDKVRKIGSNVKKKLGFYKGGEVTMDQQMDMFREGGLNQEGGMIDAESGNKVPVGSTRKEVRDDISAKLSEGEFVMPADVVRYHGLDKMMALRDEAKMGLRKMDAMGQMGNSEEATLPEEMPFGMADLIVVAEDGKEVEMAEGGYVTMANGGDPSSNVRQLGPTYTPTVSQPINFSDVMGEAKLSYKEYRNAQGNNILVAFIGGKPLYPIPEGYTEYTAGADEPVTPIQDLVRQSPPIPESNDNDQINRGYSLDDITNVSVGMLLEEEKRQNSIFGKMALGIASMVGGVFVGGTMALGVSQAQNKNLARMQDLINNNAVDPSLIPEVNAAIERTKKAQTLSFFPKVMEGVSFISDKIGIDLRSRFDPVLKATAKAVDEATGVNTSAFPARASEPTTRFPSSAQSITGGRQLETGESTSGLSSNVSAILGGMNTSGDLGRGTQVASAGPFTNEQLRQYNQGYMTAGDRYAMTMGGRGLQGTRPEGFGDQDLGYNPTVDPRGPSQIPASTRPFPNFNYESNMRDRNMRPPSGAPKTYDAFGNETISMGQGSSREDTGIPFDRDTRFVQDYIDNAASEDANVRRIPYADPGAYTFAPPFGMQDAMGQFPSGPLNVSPSNMQGTNFIPDSIDPRGPSQIPDSLTPFPAVNQQLVGTQPVGTKMLPNVGGTSGRQNVITQDMFPPMTYNTQPYDERNESVYGTGVKVNPATNFVQNERMMYNRPADTGNYSVNTSKEPFLQFPSEMDSILKSGSEQIPYDASYDPRKAMGVMGTPSQLDSERMKQINEPLPNAILPSSPSMDDRFDPTLSPQLDVTPAGEFVGSLPSTTTVQEFPELKSGLTVDKSFGMEEAMGKFPSAPVSTPAKAKTAALPSYEKGFGTVTPDKFNNLVPGQDLEPEFLRDAEGNFTTTRNPRAGMSFEYDINDPKSRTEANAKLNFFSKTGKARPEYILAGGRKVPADSALAQNDAENTASGYTGTGSGGVAIGKISGENGLSGVVKDTTKEGSKLAARANGKTVYKDSSGKAYTNSTFGSKVEVKQNKDGSWSNKTNAKGETVKYTKEAGVSSGHGTAQEQDNSDNESDSGKIICTAMNASYGFGSYRQAIWLSYSNKHLTKEHEVGYHTLFLPLVHLAYTKDNKLIRKLLEHGTRRRTADIRAELKGTKRNTLGRIYRAVLEPLCYGVGKIKMTLGE